MGGPEASARAFDRKTLCISSGNEARVLNSEDEGFQEEVQRHYVIPESEAAERLIELKARLKVTRHDFWKVLMEGLLRLTGSQFGFCSKRMVVDDEDPTTELPRIGEPGSYLMGLALYWDNGHGIKDMLQDYKYMAHGSPCGFMCHDKVFLAPQGLAELTRDNPNELPFPCEGYLGVPLFHQGSCFAHFGLLWTAEGLANRSLSWGYLEMIMHSLEDIILRRLLDGTAFAKPPLPKSDEVRQIVSPETNPGLQGLQPYARSLSHELRTPMQGVVGMLDIMHATVQEAMEGQAVDRLKDTFHSLRESIEMVQDSSRRAVEATDNVVHAYALNMQIPDTPVDFADGYDGQDLSRASVDDKSETFLQPQSFIVNQTRHKRRRASSASDWHHSIPTKIRTLERPRSPHYDTEAVSPRTETIRQAVQESEEVTTPITPDKWRDVNAALRSDSTWRRHEIAPSIPDSEGTPGPSLRHTRVRDLLHYVISESLRVGGRPDSAIAEHTPLGEIIEVRTRSSAGDAKTTVIEWSVDPFVPETIIVDERDLSKLVSCVFLNAIKFTDSGKIMLNAQLSPDSRYIVINVVDSGPGIAKDFLPKLFKPFARGDDSLTRQKDGLGLGLLVAKGIARKIKGDLKCVRSDVTGPNRGTEFEIRVPMSSVEGSSYPGSPIVRTPTPLGSPLEPPEPSNAPVQAPHHFHHRPPSSRSELESPEFEHGPSPLQSTPASRRNSLPRKKTPVAKFDFDKKLAEKYPLTFLVAEDNKINRKLLVKMLLKLGYPRHAIHEAYDGAEAVRQMAIDRESPVDLVLMDLWMPTMDGYEATERILGMEKYSGDKKVTVLAVSADVTEEALTRAAEVGISGFMTKPYKLLDLERLIAEYSERRKMDIMKQNGFFVV